MSVLSGRALSVNSGGYPFRHQTGVVTTYSDISPVFSRQHAEHGLLVWNYFARLFRYPPGNRVELYYTRDTGRFNSALTRYPAILIKGGRQVTCGWAGDHRKWFIIPYTIPDFGTLQHELSHDFLYFTWPQSEAFPWFKEGSGMYFESGCFNRAGELVVMAPHAGYAALYRKWAAQGQLYPLAELVRMPRLAFYRADPSRTYAQALMFFFYLMKRHEGAMARVFAALNDRALVSNEALLQLLCRETGMTLAALDGQYRKFYAP